MSGSATVSAILLQLFCSHSNFIDIVFYLQVTQRFSKDTAYVLVYKKLHDSELRAGRIDMNETIASVNIDPPLRRDLRESVEKDNILFLQVTFFKFCKKHRTILDKVCYVPKHVAVNNVSYVCEKCSVGFRYKISAKVHWQI